MERSRVIGLVAAAALGVTLAAAAGGLAFINSGLYDVGASKPHTKLTFYVTNETMLHSVRRHAAGIAVPSGFTPAQVARGYCAYAAHCVACHGAAAVAREHWAGGMEPQPPYLLDAADKFTPAELFWIVRNGIKMTGMPSWKDSLSDAQLWEVVAWLEASRQLPPQTYLAWRSAGVCLPSRARRGEVSAAPFLGQSAIRRPAPARPTAATGESAPSARGAARP